MRPPPARPATLLARRVYRATNALLALAARACWHRPVPSRPARVCVWRTGNIGDLVCALPALAAVRRTWPEAELVLLTSPGRAGAPGARELLGDAPWIDRLPVYHPGPGTARELAGELRGCDLVLRLPQNMTTPLRELRDLAFLRLAARVRCARGFAVGSLRWLGKGAARALAGEGELEHESERLLALLDGFVLPTRGAEFPLPAGAALRAEADGLLARFGLFGVPLLALSPGAKRETNRWPVERFAEIARRWTEDGGRVLVLGGAGDRPLGGRIRELAGPSVVDLTGESPLPLSVELLRRADLLLSNDTGAMHLAAAVRTPAVVPFSARDVPGRWFPYRHPDGPEASRAIVHRRRPSCSPCWEERCPHENRCLSEIGVAEVWESARAVRDLRARVPARPAAAI